MNVSYYLKFVFHYKIRLSMIMKTFVSNNIYCNTTKVLPGDAARAAGGHGGDAGLPNHEPAQGGQPPAAQPRLEGGQTQQGGQKIFAT